MLTLNNTGRGHLFSATHTNGQRYDVLFPIAAHGSVLSDMVSYLVLCSQAFIDDYSGATKKFIGDELTNQTRGFAAGRFSKAYADAVKITRKESQDVDYAKAMAMAVDPATPATAHLRARALARWDAADVAGKASMLRDISYEGLAALIETTALADVPVELQKVAKDRYMVERHFAKTGIQADHQLQPSIDNPIATGPHREAARRAAADAIAELNGRSETVASVGDALRGIVNVVALATELSAQSAYELLLTGKAA